MLMRCNSDSRAAFCFDEMNAASTLLRDLLHKNARLPAGALVICIVLMILPNQMKIDITAHSEQLACRNYPHHIDMIRKDTEPSPPPRILSADSIFSSTIPLDFFFGRFGTE